MLGLQLTKKNSAYLLQMLDHPLSFLSSAQLPLSKLNSFPLSFSLILPPSTFTARSLAISHLKDWWRLMKWLVWADFKPQATQSSCLTSSYKNILKSLMFLWGTGVPYCLGHNFTIVLSQSETILPPKEAITLSSISVSAPTISFQVAVWYSRLLFLFIFFFGSCRWRTRFDCFTAPWAQMLMPKSPGKHPAKKREKVLPLLLVSA